MRILGIDPGLKATGFGVIDLEDNGKPKVVEAGTIEPKQKDLIQHRLHTIYQGLDSVVQEYQPQVAVLEKLYAHHKYTTTAAILGHARGVICLVCAQHNLELIEHSVKRIRKAVVGNGNATKVQTQQVVANILKIDAEKLTLDASDALALALGHASMASQTLVSV